LEKRLVVVTGKGGVGKSTVALALGMKAAARGRRTIVCEVAAQERISHAFHHGRVGFKETELAPNLFTISIDPDEAMREYVLLSLKVKAMRDLLFRSKLFTYLAAATPGLRELVTIGKVWELSAQDEGLEALRPGDPGRSRHGARHRLSADAEDVCERRAGRADRDPGRDPPQVHHQPPQNRRGDRRPAGGETALLERELTRTVNVAVDRIFLNGLYPGRFTHADEKALDKAAENTDGPAGDAIAAALTVSRRFASQREQLERLKSLTRAPVTTLPFLFEPELEAEELRQLVEVIP
jgi:hypothetical protein